MHDLSEAINNHEQTGVILIEFAKAFNEVPHAKLINKVINIFKNTRLTNWITVYLTSTALFVRFNNKRSSIISVDSGVPQGAVLAPLLFITYIHYIFGNMNIRVLLFADDYLLY